MKYYAGIGARNTPPQALRTMRLIAQALEEKGYCLRSGGAKGADTAFESGAHNTDIYYSADATQEAKDLACNFHPNPSALRAKGDYVMGLMGRNMQILLGRELDTPVEFVVCWTPGGEITGGTGQAMRAAYEYNIKVYNIAKEEDLNELRSLYVNLP